LWLLFWLFCGFSGSFVAFVTLVVSASWLSFWACLVSWQYATTTRQTTSPTLVRNKKKDIDDVLQEREDPIIEFKGTL
jgi:CHASE3 domain sensor protein